MKKLLANYVRLSTEKDVLYLATGLNNKKFKDEILNNIIIEACLIWKTPKTTLEVKNLLLEKFGQRFFQFIDLSINTLESGQFLVEENQYNKNDRYSRHNLYFSLNKSNPKEVQNKINKSKVAIIGCGGIGNYIGVPLATAGVGEIHLLDFDTVETSNLTRQIMFTEGDVGQKKVDILKKRIHERNSITQVEAKNIKFNKYSDFDQLDKDYDLVVLSADGDTDELFSVTFLVNKFCIENNIPYINVGYIEDIAVWGPFVVPGKTACQNCEIDNFIGINQSDKLREINKHYQSPSASPINSLAASAALSDILKYLGGYGDISSYGKRMALKTDTFEKIEYKFKKNPKCFCNEKS